MCVHSMCDPIADFKAQIYKLCLCVCFYFCLARSVFFVNISLYINKCGVYRSTIISRVMHFLDPSERVEACLGCCEGGLYMVEKSVCLQYL